MSVAKTDTDGNCDAVATATHPLPVQISHIDPGSATDIYDVEGDNTIIALRASTGVTRLDYNVMPSKGYVS